MRGALVFEIANGIVVGVLATLTMDVLGRAAGKLGLVAGARGEWVGRWYLGMLRGRFAHANIAESTEMPGERRAAFIGHYLIGITLAISYVLGAEAVGISDASLLAALTYGVATCVFPWFLVYPALGFGAFGLRAPAGLKPIRSSVWNHLFYGIGLWWAASVLRLLGGFA